MHKSLMHKYKYLYQLISRDKDIYGHIKYGIKKKGTTRLDIAREDTIVDGVLYLNK
jgi:hypothetical protein